MGTRAYVAVDLGAESGRVIVGTLSREGDGGSGPASLDLHEAHRFAHEPVRIQDALCWNVPHLWREILAALRAAGDWARQHAVPIVSVGVDGWGVDFVLLDARGEVIAPPRCYRDARHQSGLALLQEKIGFEQLYGITGVQEMSINTLAQLAGAIVAADADVGRADRLLLMPDYFHFLLSGQAANEATIASTTQMVDAASGDWSQGVMSRIGVPGRLVRPPYAPGKCLGTLRPHIAAATGLGEGVRVVAPGSHDTASAVAGVPATAHSWAYLSSGTWSLMGMERTAPILTAQARRAGFTNERGTAGTYRFHKNLIGLWLVQEVRRDLERLGTRLDYAQLTQAAAAAPPFRTRIDASHPSLASPGGAIEKIKTLARQAGDPEPRTPGEFTRCCLEALAMAYRRCLEDLETLACEDARRVETIHIVGGGSKNALLNQMTADAVGESGGVGGREHRRVLAGPAEATAAGNVLVQAMADGQAPGLADIRAIVARSFDLQEYRPADTAQWTAQYARHRAIGGPRP